MVDLECYCNRLTSLPPLPSVTNLWCSYNQLTSLPPLPLVTKLYCSFNKLTCLPNLPLVTDLWCAWNQLTSLPPLHFACKYGHIELVKFFLDQGANIEAGRHLSLRWAAENGHTSIVELLLDRGADVHIQNDYCLRWASSGGHLDTVKLLLDRGAYASVNGDQPLYWAISTNRIDVVELLVDRIKASFRPEMGDIFSSDMLETAITYKFFKIAKLLVDKKFFTNLNNSLYLAVVENHYNFVKFLLDNGANANNQKALKLAVRNGYQK